MTDAERKLLDQAIITLVCALAHDEAVLHGKDITVFARVCGWSLSRAHSKGGSAIVLSGYFGDSDHCDESLADFAVAYADQCEADYESFKKAVSRGLFPAEPYGAA